MSPPRIDPRYLSDERDSTTLLKGAKITRRSSSPALEDTARPKSTPTAKPTTRR